MIHLDTSFLIRGLIGATPEFLVVKRWADANVALGTSSPAWAEFLCGPVTDAQVRAATRVVGAPVPFAEADAEVAADLFNHGGRRRGTLVDCMIAAVALRAGAELATVNVRDFTGFVPLGLTLAHV